MIVLLSGIIVYHFHSVPFLPDAMMMMTGYNDDDDEEGEKEANRTKYQATDTNLLGMPKTSQPKERC